MQSAHLTVNSLVHAYRQAPWRLQRQWIGMFLLAILGIAMVASLYLDVTAQAAISGREIQDLSGQTTAVQQANADLETKLAQLTSDRSMEQRALALGYEPVDSSQVQYIIVPGYAAPAPSIMAVAPALQPSAPSTPPEYTESLIDWLQQNLESAPAATMMGISP